MTTAGSYPVVLPFWSGERSLGWQSTATGHISNITLSTTALDILRGILDGLAYRLSAIVEAVAHLSSTADSQEAVTDRRVLMGSGTALEHSSFLRQMIVDYTGIKLMSVPPKKWGRFVGGGRNSGDGCDGGGVPGESTSRGVALCMINN